MSALQITIEGRLFIPQRIFCIGKNYDEHVKELGSTAPEEPVVFMKPVCNIVAPGDPVHASPWQPFAS